MRAFCLFAIQVVYGLSIRGTDDELNQGDGQVIMDVNPSGAGGKGQQHFIKEEPVSPSRVAELPTDVGALHASMLSFGLVETAASLLKETQAQQVHQLHQSLLALGFSTTAETLLSESKTFEVNQSTTKEQEVAPVDPEEPPWSTEWGEKMFRGQCPCDTHSVDKWEKAYQLQHSPARDHRECCNVEWGAVVNSILNAQEDPLINGGASSDGGKGQCCMALVLYKDDPNGHAEKHYCEVYKEDKTECDANGFHRQNDQASQDVLLTKRMTSGMTAYDLRYSAFKFSR